MSNRILIIDDNYEIVDVISIVLQKKGFVCEAVYNGESAKEKFNSFKPDIIILDYRLPDIDGYTLIKHFKKEGFDAKYILVVTGYSTDEYVEKCYSEGISAFIKKPFSIYEILGVVNNLIAIKKTSERVFDEVAKRKSLELKFEKLISFSVFGVLLTDHNLNIHMWNKGAERIFGYSESEIIGLPLEKVLKFDIKDNFFSVQDQKDKFFETYGVTRSGEKVFLEINFSIEVFEEDSMLAIFIKDISQRKSLEILEKENEKQKEEVKSLEMFHATMITLNHKLKQPLYSLISNVELVKKISNHTQEQSKFLTRISDSTKLIANIIDQMGELKDIKFTHYAGRYKMLDIDNQEK
ncbi:MAG: response regulator [Candidatus Delongbacteria bacterium]|nr:response regulator [Candidatus Delongbacteria bacterium]MBN2837054.1 response regulator [Candidatus Delongbacteria bacterium]